MHQKGLLSASTLDVMHFNKKSPSESATRLVGEEFLALMIITRWFATTLINME